MSGNTKKVCGACGGKGVEYREVRENSTGYWTKEKFTCKRCHGTGWVN